MIVRALWSGLFFVWAAACTERIQLGASDAGAGIPGLVALRVTPAVTELELVDPAPRTVTFSAIGTFAGGDERDVTALVDWSTDNGYPGAFDAPGHYLVPGHAGGLVTVTAASGDTAATATVRVVITRTISDTLFPPPVGADDLFANAPVVGGDPLHAPRVSYPADGTRLPPEVARLLFQYAPGASNDTWRLGFESEFLHLTVLTGAARWQPDAEVWSWISLSNVDGAFSFSVTGGVAGDPTAVYAGAPITVAVAAAPVAQVLYFWSAEAIRQAPLSAVTASLFYPAPGDATCVGCHAISRDGRRMALGYGGETLRVVDLPQLTAVGAGGNVRMGWVAFSPDGALVVVADKGKLSLVDAATGMRLGPVPLPMGALATHPDWSPDGAWLAVSLGSVVGNKDMKGGRIARLSYADGMWGAPEVLVESAGDNDNNFFPRWSPDGSVIAYVHADGPSRGAPTAELRLIPADGGTPIALPRLNRRVGPDDGVTDVGNHFPSWAPSTEPGRAWLAFASRRAYGDVLAPGARDQVWVAAVALDGIASGADPSSPAFWLPAQDPTELNDGPVWAPIPGLE